MEDEAPGGSWAGGRFVPMRIRNSRDALPKKKKKKRPGAGGFWGGFSFPQVPHEPWLRNKNRGASRSVGRFSGFGAAFFGKKNPERLSIPRFSAALIPAPPHPLFPVSPPPPNQRFQHPRSSATQINGGNQSAQESRPISWRKIWERSPHPSPHPHPQPFKGKRT